MKNNYEIRGETTVIFYTNRKDESFEILIDTEDLEKVKNYNWHVTKTENKFYCKTFIKKGYTLYLHKILLDFDSKIFLCRHLNSNTLDNRKNNLKIFNRKQSHPNTIFIEKDNHIVILVFNKKHEPFEILVDKDDFLRIKDYTWFVRSSNQNTKTYYASTKSGGINILLHHLILDFKYGNMEIDHVNRNGLDNRKENLRICTHQQNMWNQTTRETNKSGFTGVFQRKDNGKWRAYITNNGKRHWLGTFSSFQDAVDARKIAELEIYKDFYIYTN